jgi:hypothetical protein
VNQAEEEALVTQIAALAMVNVPEVRIAEELQISRRQVSRIKGTPAYRQHLKDIADKASQKAVTDFLDKAADLSDLAIKALRKGLEDGKIEAVRTWGEFVGLKSREESKDAGAGNLTIVMPGAAEPKPKDIEVTVEPKENE